MKTEKRATGDWGEENAVEYLLNKGYDIVARNFSTKMGELDVVAWHKKYHFGQTLCFIEVKTRAKSDGAAERATGWEKLQRMTRAARAYCINERIDIGATPIQFEQVSVYGVEGDPVFRHYVIPVD